MCAHHQVDLPSLVDPSCVGTDTILIVDVVVAWSGGSSTCEGECSAISFERCFAVAEFDEPSVVGLVVGWSAMLLPPAFCAPVNSSSSASIAACNSAICAFIL